MDETVLNQRPIKRDIRETN